MRNDPRTLFRWAMYDWANSAYATAAAATLLPAYFTSTVAPDGASLLGRHVDATALWGYLTGSWALALFLVTPVLGAIADYAAAKKRFLIAFAVVGAAAAALLSAQGPGDLGAFVPLFLVAQIGFVSANVFYDGFLPDLTTPDTIDRVSARGYAFGYAGGAIVLAGAIGLYASRSRLGLDGAQAARAGILLAAVWWLGFGLYAMRGLREPQAPLGRAMPAAKLVAEGFARTWRTLVRLRAFPQLLLFLVAYMVYNDGVQAMNNMAAAYATGELRLDQGAVLWTFLASQFSALPGALVFGWWAGRIGAKRAIFASLLVWIAVASGAATLARGAATAFLSVGVVAGFAQGGNQALSRSLYGSMVPESASAEFYGFYSVFSKFSAIWGPLTFAVVSQATGSPRAGVLSIAAIFVIGLVLLTLVDVDRARRARLSWRLPT